MKSLFLVLGLFLFSGCTVQVEDDMGLNQYGDSGGWSATGTMTNDGKSHAAHLQVDFLKKDTNRNPSKNYTVQFSVGPTKLSNKSLLPVPVNPVAEIKWSVEGNDVRRLVSVVNGLSVTGVGEAIKVSVSDDSPQDTNFVVNYDVSINVAPGSRPSINQPPTLIDHSGNNFFLQAVAGGASKDVIIPQDAGVISSYVTVYSAGGVPIAENAAEVTLKNVFSVGQKSYDPRIGWVSMIPGAAILTLTNRSGVDQFYTVTFGIDG